MVRPLRIQYPGAVYHVTHRGIERKPIFRDDADRRSFLEILGRSLETYNVSLYCFVLMSNHFHLLVETPLGNLGEFMRHFNIIYTSYFNRRHRRVGNLYQGRYKSFLIDKDAYLSAVSRYIHLNPVRVAPWRKKSPKERMQYLREYAWSTLPGYVKARRQLDYVEYDTVFFEFGGNNSAGRANYKKQLGADLRNGLTLHEKVVGQSLLGSEEFLRMIRDRHLATVKDRERPSVSRLQAYTGKEEVFRALEKGLHRPIGEILAGKGTERQIAMDLLYRFGGMKNKEIGALCGLDYSTVSQGRKRLAAKRGNERNLDNIIKEIEGYCQE